MRMVRGWHWWQRALGGVVGAVSAWALLMWWLTPDPGGETGLSGARQAHRKGSQATPAKSRRRQEGVIGIYARAKEASDPRSVRDRVFRVW